MAKAKRTITRKTIKPGKDITASMAEDFRQSLRKFLDQGVVEMTIDLTGVKMIDSVGLGILIATHNSLENVGGSLSITNVSQNIYNLFNTMRLDQHFEVKTETAH
ncbi:MAG: STAS domain-containing protein [Deltaproteobacteria bacterium]|nr:STAS domain-containing protein [Deltaproteobacteria bacterium]